jgi:hypothetical protein
MATCRDASHRVFPPLELKLSYLQTHPWQDHPSVPHNGRVRHEEEVWGGRTFSQSRMEPCVVGKGQRSIRRNDAPSMMGPCVWSMRPASLTVALVPYAPSVKDMAPPPAKPRRVSAVLHPLPQRIPEVQPPSCLSALASHPILWGDWSRSQPRRDWIRWQRSHLVTLEVAPVPPASSSPPLTFSRAQRAHWRMTRQQRLTRNRQPLSAPPVEITVYGLSTAFAQALGLRIA